MVRQPGGATAPEIPAGLEWLNTDRPLSLAQLKGKIVLLDFWTYGCINCIHNFDDIERLQAEFPDELVVIGVHSGKFPNERQVENLRQVIQRYGLEHPVVNDPGLRMWDDWGIPGWPTLVLVDPAGNLADMHVGEGPYKALRPLIVSLIRVFDARGRLDRTPLDLKLEREGLPQTALAFPGQVLADEVGRRLFIADSNRHRIVVADLASGQVLSVMGGGEAAFRDGDLSTAAFARPQGMALSLDGRTLYVADTGNHAIRRVDLDSGSVVTLAGTGVKASAAPSRHSSQQGGSALDVDLNSPWDLALEGARLYIAMAGAHQLWSLDLPTGVIAPLAGTSVEGVRDGLAADAELAQPSGLALDGRGRLYFADAESSTIRWTDLTAADPGIRTLAGGISGLFQFGDLDGVGSYARLQHPLGVAYHEGLLYMADTYNHKVKRVDPQTGTVRTFLGSERGWRDGRDPLFYEPGGIDAAGPKLYVADTNNHAIRVIDLDTKETRTLVLKGLERFMPAPGDGEGAKVVRLSPIAAGAGEGTLRFDVVLPPGYKVNDLAPSVIAWQADGEIVTPPTGADRSFIAADLPLVPNVTLNRGQGELTGSLVLFYCRADQEGICLIERAQITVPVTVDDVGSDELRIVYHVGLPGETTP
jgi:DNA-binding beta-propeller fold protein YncE